LTSSRVVREQVAGARGGAGRWGELGDAASRGQAGHARALLSKGSAERVRARGEWGWSRSRWGWRGAERAGRPAWAGVARACALDRAGPGARLSEAWRQAAARGEVSEAKEQP
jgi:hypothetical protein